jgi:hypothetical protein
VDGGLGPAAADGSGEAGATRPPRRPIYPEGAAEERFESKLRWLEKIWEENAWSAARAKLVTLAAEMLGVDESTVRRMRANVEEGGEEALFRQQRSDKGQTRCFVRMSFDNWMRAQEGGAELLPQIGAKLDEIIKGLRAGTDYASSDRLVATHAAPLLREYIQALGHDVPEDLCKAPPKRIRRPELDKFRRVGLKRYRPKIAYDKSPAIRRNWDLLLPLDLVVIDIKHLDFEMKRRDGTRGWPKLIAHLDAGTGRLHCEVVLCEKRRNIRQSNVAHAFVTLVAHPRWGLPRRLYYDRGKELDGLKVLRAALARYRSGDQRVIMRSLPRRPRGRPIEQALRRFDLLEVCILPAYAGSNRMDHRHDMMGGKRPAFDGDFEDLQQFIANAVANFNATPFEYGRWKGRSPEDLFAAKLGEFKRTAVDPIELELMFRKKPKSYAIRNGLVELGDENYFHHDSLFGLQERVWIAPPAYEGPLPLASFDQKDWFELIRDEPLHPLSVDTVREARRRQRLHNQALAEASKQAPGIDASLIAQSHRPTPERPIPETAHTIPLDPGEEIRRMAKAVTGTFDQPRQSAVPRPSWEDELEEIEAAEAEQGRRAS